jgi:uncharacterized membrane protein
VRVQTLLGLSQVCFFHWCFSILRGDFLSDDEGICCGVILLVLFIAYVWSISPEIVIFFGVLIFIGVLVYLSKVFGEKQKQNRERVVQKEKQEKERRIQIEREERERMKSDFYHRIDLLQSKYPSIDLNGIKQLFTSYDDRGLEYNRQKAIELLEEIEEKVNEFENIQEDIHSIKIKINKLTERLAEGDIDSDSYTRALNDLESLKKSKEEELWKKRNKLFKDDYEKPF